MKFNEKLKVLRESKGYTQDELADKLNIARQSVSKWETGINEPDFDTLKKLCQILDCSISELIDDDGTIVTTKEEKKAKTANWLFRINIMLAIAASLVIIYLLRIAPDQVAQHFGTDIETTYGSRWNIVAMLLIAVMMVPATIIVRFTANKQEAYKKYKVMLQIMMLCFQVAMAALGIILSIVMINLSPTPIDWNNYYSSMTTAIVMAIIIGIAPFTHPKWNKRNPLFGFRTNFTLTNEEGWNKVNAFTAFAMLIGGIIAYVLVLVFAATDYAVFFVFVILAAILVALVYHEVLRRKIKQRI